MQRLRSRMKWLLRHARNAFRAPAPTFDLRQEAERPPSSLDRPDTVDLIGPAFDSPALHRAEKTLIICSAPRTGSYELSRYLMAAGIGVPHEYFSHVYARALAARWHLAGNVLAGDRIGEFIETLRRRRAAGGVFAVKLQYRQFVDCLLNAHGDALFSNAVIVHLFRPDVVAQSESWLAAKATGVWDYSQRRTTSAGSTGGRSVTDALAEIDDLVQQDAGFRRLFFLLGIRPVFLTMDELFARPHDAIARIAAALDIQVDESGLDRAIAVSAPYAHRAEGGPRDVELSAALRRAAFRKG